MLWGGGTADGEDWNRLQAFRAINWTPQYIIGFEEPDCPAGEGSAGMTVDAGESVKLDSKERLLTPPVQR